MIYRIPTMEDYQPIIDEVTGEFRKDLKRILGKPDGYTLAPAQGRLPKPQTDDDDDYCVECQGPCLRRPRHGDPW